MRNDSRSDANTDGVLTPDHGVTRFSDLLRAGVTKTQVDQLVDTGRLVRVRRGWYAVPAADAAVVRAVRLGGTLSCVSALQYYGVWVPPDPRLHIRMSEHHQARAVLPGGVHICPLPIRSAPGVAVDSLSTALLAAVRCLDDEGLVVVMDSILNQRLMGRGDLVRLLTDAPHRVQRLLREVDPNAQSGTESMVRFRLRRLGVKVQTQVFIEGVGRVDMLVGERLVIEADSRQHHTGVENYANDRRRGIVLLGGETYAARLTYEQVVFGWDEVQTQILRFVRRRAHRAPRRRAA